MQREKVEKLEGYPADLEVCLSLSPVHSFCRKVKKIELGSEIKKERKSIKREEKRERERGNLRYINRFQ